MAFEDDLQARSGAERAADRAADRDAVRGLVDRMARLEAELAALKREFETLAADPAPQLTRESWAVAPPPPPPVPTASLRTPADSLPLTSGVWSGESGSGEVRSAAETASQPHASRGSFEDRLGSQIFNRIGILLVLIGTAWFLKYAVDHQWIGPAGRIIAGLLAGAGLVLWSERFRSKGFAAFSYSLKALGSGVLYLSLWAAFQIYHLLPASIALGLMVLVTAWNAYMAWSQDSEVLAAYALAGGFATPMLLSTGGNHEIFLFTYLLAIDIAVVLLVRLRGWPRLLLGAFPLTMAFFIAWYAEFFVAGELAITAVFIVLFDSTFSSVPIGAGTRATPASHAAPGVAAGTKRVRDAVLIEDILLPLANAAFLSLSLYSVLQDSGYHWLLPWLMVLLSAVYLGFMRLPQSRTASAIHLSIAIVFLTIAIPLKASGEWITVGWLVEGLALLWVATRLAQAKSSELGPQEQDYASTTLRWLASAALILGFGGIFVHAVWSGMMSAKPFFNADTATALVGAATFAAAAWLALRVGRDEHAHAGAWDPIAMAGFAAMGSTALLLTLRELLAFGTSGTHAPFQSADFFTALFGLAILAGVVAASLRVAKAQSGVAFWQSCAAFATIAFNLIAVLTGVREISAVWDVSASASQANLDAPLQQALAISGFLMLYGAALLAIGFWRRSAFLRWQALLLLIFTICKAFLYDMRNLSQGYRVVSFLALGALLMTISFAYQKDWLSLREEAHPGGSAEDAKGDR